MGKRPTKTGPNLAAKRVARDWLSSLSPEDRESIPGEHVPKEYAERDAKSDEQRLADRQNERVRWQSRKHKRKKHLPVGLVKVSDSVGAGFYCVGRFDNGSVQLPIGADLDGTGLGSITTNAGAAYFCAVSPALLRQAEALRGLFDFGPVPDGADLGQQGTLIVETEIAEAISAASAVLRDIWVSILLNLLTDALRHIYTLDRNRNADKKICDWHREMAQPSKVAEKLQAQMSRFAGLSTVPDWLDAGIVEWLLAHFNPGLGRRGHAPGKYDEPGMRRLLADPVKLKSSMAPKAKRKPAKSPAK